MNDQPGLPVLFAAAVLASLGILVLAQGWADTGQIWFRDATGQPLGHDFLAYWAAGLAVWQGKVASAYDPQAFSGMLAALGPHPDAVSLRWLNPPHFALMLAPLALLPLDVAFLAFVLGTALLFAATLRLAVPRLAWPTALLLTFGTPAAYATVVKGQNGFLTGALIGAGLVLLDRRPILAGICFGLLTYKPQFGVVLPLLLTVGRHWRAMGAAAVTALSAAGLAAMITGPEAWFAFSRSIGGAGASFLGQGQALDAMQSVYAVLWPHLGSRISAVVHAAVLAVGLFVTARLWWPGAALPHLRNAATLGVAFLGTPYVFNHDVPMLVLGAAMLLWAMPANQRPAGSAAVLGVLVLTTPLPIVMDHGAPGALLAAALVVIAGSAARRSRTQMPSAAADAKECGEVLERLKYKSRISHKERQGA